MSYWKNKVVDLGIIVAGKAKTVLFKATDNIPNIKQIIPYCGCTSPKYNNATKELKVVYNNGKIPNQVQGPQIINQRIDIIYENDQVDVLLIKAIKTRQ